MTGFEHSIIATSLLALFFYVGRYIGRGQASEDIIEKTLITLEDKGYIYCTVNADGEKELQPYPKNDLTE